MRHEINEKHPITLLYGSFGIFTLIKLCVGQSDFENLAPFDYRQGRNWRFERFKTLITSGLVI